MIHPDSKVKFKIFLGDEEAGNSEIRQCLLSVPVTSKSLQKDLGEFFKWPQLENQKETQDFFEKFKVLYEDREGHHVTVGSDAEFDLLEVESIPVKLFISTKCTSNQKSGYQLQHSGYSCNGCQGIIAGYRYKCLTCPNHDHCIKCENDGIHNEHDVIRISEPKVYPFHFFARIQRLYERLQSNQHHFRSVLPNHSYGPPGQELMAKDLIDEENDSSEDIIASAQDGFNSSKGETLPTIEELTKNMQTLADRDNDVAENEEVGTENNDEKASGNHGEKNEIRLTNQEGIKTIQELQDEINKLLEPLANEPEDQSNEPPCDTVAEDDEESEYEYYDDSEDDENEQAEIVIERAVIERQNSRPNNPTDESLIPKRKERQSSESDSSLKGVTPSKCPRKFSHEYGDHPDLESLDEITVDEVIEVRNEEEPAQTEVSKTEANHDVIKVSNGNPDYSDVNRPKRATSIFEDVEDDPEAKMELRRALYRAGLDTSCLLRSSSRLGSTEPFEKKIEVPIKRSPYSVFDYNPRPLPRGTSLSTKVIEARNQMLSMGFTDDEGWLTQLIEAKKGDIDAVLEVLSPVK